MHTTVTHKRQGQRGVAAVEFALLLTPLVLMVFGTTELGRAIYTYNTLDKTVRDAARHLSQHGPGDPVIQTEARCLTHEAFARDGELSLVHEAHHRHLVAGEIQKQTVEAAVLLLMRELKKDVKEIKD